MPTSYTASAVYPTFPLDLIDDGETVDANALMTSATASKGLIRRCLDGLAYFKNAPNFDGAVTCDTTLAVTGAVTCSSTLAVTGTSTLTGAVSCTASLTAGTTISAGGNITAGTSGGGGGFKLQSRSVTRSTGGIMYLQSAATLSSNGAITVPANDIGDMMVDLPHGATLTKMSFGVNPQNASPPAGTKVVGGVFKRAIATGATTTIVSTTDPTTGVDYGAAHSFDTAAVSEVIDRTTYRYYVNLTGETGGGADVCAWYGCTWTADVAGIDDGVS
jgi:hypothetical protein